MKEEERKDFELHSCYSNTGECYRLLFKGTREECKAKLRESLKKYRTTTIDDYGIILDGRHTSFVL